MRNINKPTRVIVEYPDGSVDTRKFNSGTLADEYVARRFNNSQFRWTYDQDWDIYVYYDPIP